MENNTDIRRGRHLWSRPYYAGSAGGAPLNVITEHVKAQDQPSA